MLRNVKGVFRIHDIIQPINRTQFLLKMSNSCTVEITSEKRKLPHDIYCLKCFSIYTILVIKTLTVWFLLIPIRYNGLMLLEWLHHGTHLHRHKHSHFLSQITSKWISWFQEHDQTWYNFELVKVLNSTNPRIKPCLEYLKQHGIQIYLYSVSYLKCWNKLRTILRTMSHCKKISLFTNHLP